MGIRGPKKLPKCLISEETTRIQNRVNKNREWMKVVDRIRHFMNISRRSWANATLYLLELALDIVEKED